MAGRIPQAFIDDLISRVDIVEVIDQYVPLKKGGRDFKACCPFHNEKTPSFTVSQAKQFYHCFGCQAHGTAIGFLIDYAHMDFVEAVEALAQRVGVEIPREASAEHSRDRLAPQYELMEAANRHFRGALRRHPQAQPAVDYLKGRGLSGEIAAEFQLGFAPPGWENIIDALGRGAEAKQQLVEVGLAIERPDGSLYDRFRNRIIFPIIDRRGRTVGYGGRVLGDDTPKYLNSPETALFHKGRELYGLYHARAAGRAPVQILVVEGYMDVVALAQHGVRNAVATLGTAVTTEHLELLFRVCPDIVYCFDGDEAGRRAAWRGLETTLPLMREGRQALFMFLPDGEDPDSLVRSEGKETFLARAASATSLGTYLFEQLTARVDLTTLDGRSRLAELARPLLASIPPGAFRSLAVAKLADLTGMEPEDSATLIMGARHPSTRRSGAAAAARQKQGARSLVRQAVTALVHHPRLALEVDAINDLKTVELPGTPLLLEIIEMATQHPNLTTGALLERFRDHEHARHLAKLATEECAPLSEGLTREFRDSIEKLERVPTERRLDDLLAKSRRGTLDEADRRELMSLTAALGAEALRGPKS